jgi:hypothetical protein
MDPLGALISVESFGSGSLRSTRESDGDALVEPMVQSGLVDWSGHHDWQYYR